MVLPIPNLDDRRFDDLVKEGRERVSRHLPELTQIAPGDPVHAMVDLFAYLTETMLYRMNLIPERQRRAVMNLLQIPMRSAKPARGIVCVDAGKTAVTLPSLIRDGVQLKAGQQSFTGAGELQATPLSLTVSIKRKLDETELSGLGLSLQELRDQYGIKNSQTPQPFEPKAFVLGKEILSLENSLDKHFYLAFLLPKKIANQRESLIDNLAGITLNIAIAPADELEVEEISSLTPRQLRWEFLTRDEDGNLLALPLEQVADTSRGGRQLGVVRLRLPNNTQLYDNLQPSDPMFAGLGDNPPELPAPLNSQHVVFWLRLSSEDEPDLSLGYLGVNGLDVLGQGLKTDLMLGIGDGNPDQMIKLPDLNIDPGSLVLQVEQDNAWVSWQRVDFLTGFDGDAKVYRLDPIAGVVYFGDGLEGGKRPPKGHRIRIASYLHGGGSATNLPAGEIKEIGFNASRLNLRHEWPTKGGIDAETVTQAERRIPQFLTHRNRAVTEADFRSLAQNNPVNPVAKAEVLVGFIPGNNINAVRDNVPGVVSVFVLPPRQPALRQTPKPTKGLLKDVFEYLLQRLLIGTELYVLSPEYVPLAVGVKVQVVDPETEQETLQAVQQAVVNFLWPLAPGGTLGNGWGMGVAVRDSELVTQVARVPGVRAVNSLNLFSKRSDGRWRRHQEHEFLQLKKYQLPELLGVSATSGSGDAELPSGIEALGESGNGGSSGVPAPVIPDVC
jgi:hypothetical protein